MHVAPHLIHYLAVGCGNAFANGFPIEAIQRISREDGYAAPGCFRIEASRAVGTTEDAAAQIAVTQREHAPVLVKRPAPRNYLVEREHHFSRALS